jgi:hypothetical protein
MPLVAEDSAAHGARPPWRGLVVGIVATLVFVVAIALIARATRDGAGGVPPELSRREKEGSAAKAPHVHGPDAARAAGGTGAPPGDQALDQAAEPLAGGDEAEGSDAGLIEHATVEPEPDAGPALVPGPPVDVDAVVAEVLPVIETCLQGALRFDPALGGRAQLFLVVRRHQLSASFADAPSPVLSSCVAENARALPTEAAPFEPVRIEVTVVLDGLRGRVKVVSSAVVSSEVP